VRVPGNVWLFLTAAPYWLLAEGCRRCWIYQRLLWGKQTFKADIYGAEKCPKETLKKLGRRQFSANSGRPKKKWYNVRLGTAEQRHQLKPTLKAWHRSEQKWVDDIDQIKSIDTQ
jgi:hypothetical protein